jgi:adenosylhomocysteine nucleosidase
VPGPAIAFICAMPMELEPVVEKLSLTETTAGDATIHTGTLDGRPVVAIVTGMGTAYAREGTQRLLDTVDVGHVLVVGITGAVDNETPIGALVLPEVVYNSGTGAEFRHVPLIDAPHRGTMWTTDVIITDVDRIAALKQQGVVSFDMETAAIAELCEARGIPWSVFRVISDRATDGSVDQEIFELSNMDGTPNREKIERYMREHPERLPVLAQMAQDAALARDTAADAAIAACSHIDL